MFLIARHDLTKPPPHNNQAGGSVIRTDFLPSWAAQLFGHDFSGKEG